jgi:hypothetical protein
LLPIVRSWQNSAVRISIAGCQAEIIKDYHDGLELTPKLIFLVQLVRVKTARFSVFKNANAKVRVLADTADALHHKMTM